VVKKIKKDREKKKIQV